MKRTIKDINLHNSVNQMKIDELCKTITENCETPLGWEHLTKLSGFTHRDLIGLFQNYKQTTPMAFIKNARQLKKIETSNFPQNQLFPKLLNKKNLSE
jgi:transcriptional regulator GlxA family with amidase domain